MAGMEASGERSDRTFGQRANLKHPLSMPPELRDAGFGSSEASQGTMVRNRHARTLLVVVIDLAFGRLARSCPWIVRLGWQRDVYSQCIHELSNPGHFPRSGLLFVFFLFLKFESQCLVRLCACADGEEGRKYMHPTRAGFVDTYALYQAAVTKLAKATGKTVGAEKPRDNRKSIRIATEKYIAEHNPDHVMHRPDPHHSPKTENVYMRWSDVLRVFQSIQAQGLGTIIQSVVGDSSYLSFFFFPCGFLSFFFLWVLSCKWSLSDCALWRSADDDIRPPESGRQRKQHRESAVQPRQSEHPPRATAAGQLAGMCLAFWLSSLALWGGGVCIARVGCVSDRVRLTRARARQPSLSCAQPRSAWQLGFRPGCVCWSTLVSELFSFCSCRFLLLQVSSFLLL